MVGQLIYFLTAVIFVHVAASAESTSNKRIGDCRIQEAGAYNALAEISQKARVVIGVEAIQPEKEPTIALDFPGGTVADLLNAFTTQAPDYRWEEIDNGILHVFRSGAHVSLVDVVIFYPGASNRTREEIWQDLAQRPEIAAWMRSNHCSRREFFQGKEFRDHNERISIASGPLSVAQLLDEVAVKSGENYWAVLQSPPGTECHVAVMLW
jgi:hypothetical protein